MEIIYQHPTGNANVRAALDGLESLNLLQSFHTSIASFPESLLDKVAIGPSAEIRRRQFNSSLQPYTLQYPTKEAGRLLAGKLGLSRLNKHETGIFSVDAVYHGIDDRVARYLHKHHRKVSGVYAYEDGALHSFQAAEKLGLSRFYDLPIGYWRTARRLLKLEQEKWPEWASTLTGFKDSEQKLQRKDDELRLASQILVASSFTAKTLEDFPGTLAPVTVIPYGFPEVHPANKPSVTSFKKLKLLFVGGLSQRKGIAYLFEAMKGLEKEVELTVVGRKAADDCAALNEALTQHTWYPSLPHQDILKLMRTQDVLIFPSLFEGFGLVITEAMSQGTPVITTDRTAGPDLITHDENGWLIEPGSTESIITQLRSILDNRNSLNSISNAAQESAARRPWNVYGKELAEFVKSNINL